MARTSSDATARMTGRRVRRWSRIAAAVLALSGCAVFEAPRPTDQTAVIKPGRWGAIYRGGSVEAVSVDGVDTGWRLSSDLEVAAGERTTLLYVFLCSGSATPCNNAIARAQLSIRAEAGHTYRPHAREQVNGSNRFWIWIEDEATGKAVGGTTPPAGP